MKHRRSRRCRPGPKRKNPVAVLSENVCMSTYAPQQQATFPPEAKRILQPSTGIPVQGGPHLLPRLICSQLGTDGSQAVLQNSHVFLQASEPFAIGSLFLSENSRSVRSRSPFPLWAYLENGLGASDSSTTTIWTLLGSAVAALISAPVGAGGLIGGMGTRLLRDVEKPGR